MLWEKQEKAKCQSSFSKPTGGVAAPATGRCAMFHQPPPTPQKVLPPVHTHHHVLGKRQHIIRTQNYRDKGKYKVKLGETEEVSLPRHNNVITGTKTHKKQHRMEYSHNRDTRIVSPFLLNYCLSPSSAFFFFFSCHSMPLEGRRTHQQPGRKVINGEEGNKGELEGNVIHPQAQIGRNQSVIGGNCCRHCTLQAFFFAAPNRQGGRW